MERRLSIGDPTSVRIAELSVQADTGYSMSDAALQAYGESRFAGVTVEAATQEALATSQAVHNQAVVIWGSEEAYVEAHGLYGSGLRSLSGPRTMISFTTDLQVAEDFAGEGGTVFAATVPRSSLLPQTLPGANESEVLLRHMVPVSILEVLP